LSGVAAPVLSTDAANKGYVDSSVATASNTATKAQTAATAAQATANTANSAAAAAQITANTALADVQQLQGQVNDLQNQVNTNRQTAAAGIAASMATQSAMPGLARGESAIAIGTGYYDGASALGVSFAHSMASRNIIVTAGLSAGTWGTPAARAGVAFKF
jgi:autotransporter adhesin